MKLFSMLAAATLTLAGCGGMATAISEYGSVKPVAFAHGGSTWRVYDKPDDGRLMITPTIANSAASGVIGGATLGVAGDPLTGRSAGIPQNSFSAAATAWIKQHGASCRVTQGEVLVTPQWEFRYTC